MKNVNLLLRTLLYEAIPFVTYKGTDIYVHEEYVQYSTTKPKVMLQVGNMQVEAYILMLNQTANDNSAKCLRNDEVSIQYRIDVVYPGNKGGSKLSEEISELLMSRITDGLISQIEANGLWRLWIDGYRNLNFDTNTSRVWSTVVIVNGSINQEAKIGT